MGDRMLEGICRNNIGNTELEFGNVDRADNSLEPAEAIARALDLPELLAVVILNRSSVADLRGNDASALARAVEALSLVHRHSITRLTAVALVKCARALVHTNPQLSATFHGAAKGALAAHSDWLGQLDTRLRAENHTRLLATLGEKTYQQCHEIGRGLSTRELLALTRAHTPPGSVLR
jgi:hypothetical protein